MKATKMQPGQFVKCPLVNCPFCTFLKPCGNYYAREEEKKRKAARK